MTTGKIIGIGAGVLGFGMFCESISTKGSKTILLVGLLLMATSATVLIAGKPAPTIPTPAATS